MQALVLLVLTALCYDLPTAGWGTMAIPGRRNGFWVYIVAPFVGAIAAAVIFDYVLHYDRPLAKRNKQG